MSTTAGTPSNGTSTGVNSPERQNKGKGKNVASPNVSKEQEIEDEEDEEEEEDEEDMEEDDEEEDEEEGDNEIDPSAIVTGGRRRVKVDYTSKEALEKAGLKPEGEDDSDEDME